MDCHSCSHLISVLLPTQHIGKITPCLLGQNGFPQCGRDELCYFIFKNNSQNKQVAWEDFGKETMNWIWYEKCTSSRKWQTGTSPILYMSSLLASYIVIKMVTADNAEAKEVVYWKLISTIINNCTINKWNKITLKDLSSP